MCFLNLVEILQKAFKVFSRNNGKLIPSIVLVFLVLISILVLSNFFSVKPFLTDFVFNISTMLLLPSSTDFASLIIPLKSDIRFFATIGWISAVTSSATTLLFATAVILSSSAAHRGKEKHLKHLIACVAKTWKRPFVTFFYTTLLDFGYAFFVLAFVVPFVLFIDNELTVLSVLIFILTALLYFYLAVVSTLAIVISILEEKCGIEALGMAGEIVKGLSLKGFLLKFLFGALYCVFLLLLMMISDIHSSETTICVFLLVLNSACIVKIFSLIAYTVFYYECMKMHGEEVSEIQGGMEYIKQELRIRHL